MFNEDEKKFIKNYSEKYQKYNDIRKSDLYVSIRNIDTLVFLDDSRKLIELVVRNKDKFINN